MSSLPSKASFLAHGVTACQPPEDLECPICQEGFEAEGQKSDEREQVTSEPKPATSDTAEASSSRFPTTAATSNQSSTAEETSRQSSTLNATQNQPATATVPQSQSATDAVDRTPLRVPCCRNVYCRACLFTWLEAANTCPTCRTVLFRQDANLEEDDTPLEILLFNIRQYLDTDWDDYYEETDWDDGYDSNG